MAVAGKKFSRRRIEAKQQRRQQLIDATIKCIAKKGISGTTMADITREAGLSMGIVNLHFQSKDKLFEETLQNLSDEYEHVSARAIDTAGPAPMDKLLALVNSDFSSRVCERKKLAVWFAYWGEAKSRPTYLRICAESDRRQEETIAGLCRQILAQGEPVGVDPMNFAIGLSSLVNGLWLDLLMTPKAISRERGKAICHDYVARYFPPHLPEFEN